LSSLQCAIETETRRLLCVLQLWIGAMPANADRCGMLPIG